MDFRLPELGEGVYEAEFISWLVKPGERVTRGQNLMEVMTDKATMEVPAPFAGTIGELKAEPGQQLKVGDVVLTYDTAGAAVRTDARIREGEAPAEPVDAGTRVQQRIPSAGAARGNGPPSKIATPATATKAAPSVRLMARKLGIDLIQVQGTGPQGRILIEDLSHHVRASNAGKDETPVLTPDYGKPGTRIKLHGLRRKTAERMVQSKQTIPHYGYVDECDVTDLVRLRASLRDTYTQAGIKLTYLAFIVKAAARALVEVPIVNSSLAPQSGEIVLHDRCHIGIAVATPQGLIVPVIHDADRFDIGRIASEIERLTEAARAGKSRLEDLRGGTFTITSIGGIGGLISTPVINPPEAGILGIGKVVKRPVYDDAGKLRPADMVYLSCSFDHRILDGAIAVAFGNALIRQLQNPAGLLLDNKLV